MSQPQAFHHLPVLYEETLAALAAEGWRASMRTAPSAAEGTARAFWNS